jgi:hypothetical protein
MCSTPPATTSSCAPDATSDAARFTACWADPHWQSIVVAGVSSGSPACSHALRPMLSICSPYCWTQPATTESTRAGSTPARSSSSR